MDFIFEIFCVESGDRAYTNDPEGVVSAARTLAREAREGGCGIRPTVQIFGNDKMIRQYTGVMP